MLDRFVFSRLLIPAHGAHHLIEDDVDGRRIHAQRANAVPYHLRLREVVRAQDIDGDVEAALQLVAVVGDIGQGIGGDAIALDHHPIFLIAECRAAEPGRRLIALGFNIGDLFFAGAFPMRRFVDIAVLAHRIQHIPDFARLEERGLVVEGVMLDVDGCQRALDPIEHARFGRVSEDLPAFAAQRIAVLRGQLSRDIHQVFDPDNNQPAVQPHRLIAVDSAAEGSPPA